ncbi:MAG: hypothetical protein KKA42_01650 [candidate division Zixibacteria bacterium]|nr:hypothetical protein [candidate division Zixibacteria bacterium]
MYRDVLQAVAGVEIFPIVSLLLFVAAFLSVVVYVMRMDRADIRRFSRLPLDADERSTDLVTGEVRK